MISPAAPKPNSQADLASRRVLAHKVAITLEACHGEEILQEAFAKYGTPESVNTDQGSQFTVEEFTSVVLARGLRCASRWPVSSASPPPRSLAAMGVRRTSGKPAHINKEPTRFLDYPSTPAAPIAPSFNVA